MAHISSFESMDASPDPPTLIRVSSVGSTNDLARACLSDPALVVGHLTTIVADNQTSGRGRLGRRWTSASARSLTASTIIETPLGTSMEESLPWVLLCAALAARQALAHRLVGTDHVCSIKWPNDVVVDGTRKLAGLLGEFADSEGGRARTIVGVGANLSMSLDERPTPQATSLSLEGDDEAERDPLGVRDRVLDDYLTGLRIRIGSLIHHEGDATAAGLLNEFRAQCVTVGRAVGLRSPTDPGPGAVDPAPTSNREPTTVGAAAPRRGTAEKILSDGSLQVRLDDGTMSVVTTGDVELLGGVPGTRTGEGAVAPPR